MINHFNKLLTRNKDLTDAKSLQPISLVLIDFNMPIMSGFEAITAIKKKFEEFNEERARKGQTKA